MEQVDQFSQMDFEVLSKILSYVPLSSIPNVKLICKQFHALVGQFFRIFCSEMVRVSPKVSMVIDNDDTLDCMYRLYDIYFHGIITVDMYCNYKSQLGLTDACLWWYCCEPFMAFPDSMDGTLPSVYEFRPPPVNVSDAQMVKARLCNFSVCQQVRPRPFIEEDVLKGLRNISEGLQCKLIKEFPVKCKFGLETLLENYTPLSVMQCFGERVYKEGHYFRPLKTDHMYLRSLIPFFVEHQHRLIYLFYLMTRTFPEPSFGCAYTLDLQAITSIAMALNFQPKCPDGSWGVSARNVVHYELLFGKQDRERIEAKLLEFDRVKYGASPRRDASPKRNPKK